jgi:hypothetical protein
VNGAVDVERTFAAFVRSYGGEVVEDLVGPSPPFANADYLFRSVPVVAELKRLVKDQAQDSHLHATINARFHRWMERGLVAPHWGRRQIQSHTLPIECQRELMAICAKPLKYLIKQANRQIKSTIARLGIADGKGLLILVNDGNYLLETDAALYLIGKVLGQRCRSIHSVIYLTVNLYLRSDREPGPLLVWIHAARDSIPSVNHRFVDDLFAAWRVYLRQVTGQMIGFVKLEDREAVSELRLEKPRRT